MCIPLDSLQAELTYAAAIVNGTLYMYGFRTVLDASDSQTADTWSTSSLPHQQTHG